MIDAVAKNDREIPHPIETGFKIGQDNIQPFGLDIHNPVFLFSSVSIAVFVTLTLAFQERAVAFFGWLLPFLTSAFDWFFLSVADVFLLFCLYLMVSPLGKIRLGGRNAAPDHGYAGWFAMLFAAGIGIGLMYFGVAEPMTHYSSSLGGTVVENGGRIDSAPLDAAVDDPKAARDLAMAATILHWGLHGWAVYAVIGLALAFFGYNRGLPLTLRSTFYPILGERVWGWWGHAADILAVLATLFGLVTSLGLGTEQGLAGLNHLFGWDTGNAAKISLMAFVTLCAMTSVLRGLKGGVEILSKINIVMAVLLLLFVIVAGPTADIFDTMVSGGIAYVNDLLALSMPFARQDGNFADNWTAFYWAWWFSWSPFVGMFIARISRGRTIREFIFCVILLPTIVCFVWISAFGGTAISRVIADAADPIKDAALELKLFHLLAGLPLASVTSFLGIILVLVFFVTSSDSGSIVIDTITAGGKTESPIPQQVFWCGIEGIVAGTLLLVGGVNALSALQAMVVSSGLPFAIVLLVSMASLWIGLRESMREDAI